ncbi:MAG TPA: hypothetical protein VJP77_05310, partial [Planctomycetota bacterium]|nr:hypothetical protein [Planctomycetota bacterium]
QGKRDEALPHNHPSLDPYTGGDPALLSAAGIVSLGGFEFGKVDTAEIDRYLGETRLLWIETAHCELGFALGEYKPTRTEKPKLQAELDALRRVLPAVPEKVPRALDPWLRAHLFAQRAEQVYARVQGILGVTDASFPDRPLEFFDVSTKYMGMGPYLGQKGKYEILILPSESASTTFLQWQFGLLVRSAQRWNVLDRGSLISVMHTDDGSLRVDSALHGHMAFNLGINLLDGYKLYAYELPIWMREGLGHLLEREIDPRYNTFNRSEGSGGSETKEADWLGELRKLVRRDEAPRMAELVAVESYGDLDLPDHFTCWSLTAFLVREHGPAYAAVLDRLKGLLNEQHVPDGSDLRTHHRDAIRELLGWTYADLDAAWRAWVLSPAAEDPVEEDDGLGEDGQPLPPGY